MKPKKSFGQHFLKDSNIIHKIADYVKSYQNHPIVEIGPGRGAITKELIPEIRDFIAVDADRDMIEYLTKYFPEYQNCFINADFLKFDLACLPFPQFVIFGNFPYNISSQIVFKALHHMDQVPVLLGMFQKEMAARIASGPGTKDYGILSVLCSLNYNIKILFDIHPNCFNPPPKVMSSFILMERKENHLNNLEFVELLKLVKFAFQFRRKTLRNNLKSNPDFAKYLNEPKFDLRPEDLNPQDYLALLRRLKSDTKN